MTDDRNPFSLQPPQLDDPERSERGSGVGARKRVSRLLLPFVVLAIVALFGLAFQTNVPGLTRLELTDAETGKRILSAILRDGEPVVLRWRNSLFNLDVTEVFVAENGTLIQTQVTFADPRGLPPPEVAPQDVNDLYHTGGAFSARGLRRLFTRIAYRVGEIGNPRMQIRDRVVEFKKEVGFGGGIVLTVHAVRLYEAAFQDIFRTQIEMKYGKVRADDNSAKEEMCARFRNFRRDLCLETNR